MSKTYEALIKAERLRAAQDPAALERRVRRAAEEGESLRAELRVCQEQLAALAERVDSAPSVDPAVVDELHQRLAQLAEDQERVAAEPGRLVASRVRELHEEIDRRWSGLKEQLDQIAGLSQRLEQRQNGIAPAVDAIRAEIEALQRAAAELQRAQQAEPETLEAGLAPLRAALERVTQSVDALQNEQRERRDELADARAAQQEGGYETKRVDGLSESVDAIRAQLEQAGAAHRADADRLQAEIDRLRDEVSRLQVAPAEADASDASVPAPQVEALRAEVDSLRDQLEAALGDGVEIQQRFESGIAEQRKATSSLEAELTRARHEAARSAEASTREATERLTAVDEALAHGSRQLQDVRAALEPLAGAQERTASDIEALRVQVDRLVADQPRQQQVAEDVQRARAEAAAAAQQIATTDAAQTSAISAVRQQIEALQKESASWREISAALHSAIAKQAEAAAEIDTMRAQATRIAEGQQRQLQLLADLRMRPAKSQERLGDVDSGEPASVESLEQQILALQVDRLRLDAFLDQRFELLCGILDAALQAKVDEIRGIASDTGDTASRSRKILPESLVRYASSLAARRNKKKS